MLLSICVLLSGKVAPAAISKKKSQIVVAVIDTGIDLEHPDLKKSLWLNSGEMGTDRLGRPKSSNGLDDDDNGFVDDIHGWNFAQNENDVSDKLGHGTHISGIILGKSSLDAEKPESDLYQIETRVMVLKYYDPDGPPALNILNTVRAIRYAVQMKADVINFSAGGPGFNILEKDAIEAANRAGILFVTAAGNDGTNIDRGGYYPASYRLPNILSVTAVDRQRQILSTSNFGVKNVDLAAEGKDLLSTAPGGHYQKMTGTSQATAVVTRRAVQLLGRRLLSEKLRRPANQIVSEIVQTAHPLPSLKGKSRFASQVTLQGP